MRIIAFALFCLVVGSTAAKADYQPSAIRGWGTVACSDVLARLDEPVFMRRLEDWAHGFMSGLNQNYDNEGDLVATLEHFNYEIFVDDIENFCEDRPDTPVFAVIYWYWRNRLPFIQSGVEDYLGQTDDWLE